MLPNNAISSYPLADIFTSPDDMAISDTVDFERGGIALNDASQGLDFQDWTVYLDNADVMCGAVAGAKTLMFSRSNLNALSLAFDQNMRPTIAFRESDHIWLWWYDSMLASYTFTDFGVGKDPRVTLDDKRYINIDNSDVVFAYIQGGNLYYRLQRDRYLVAYLVRSGLEPVVRLRNIGMGRNWRLQFELV